MKFRFNDKVRVVNINSFYYGSYGWVDDFNQSKDVNKASTYIVRFYNGKDRHRFYEFTPDQLEMFKEEKK